MYDITAKDIRERLNRWMASRDKSITSSEKRETEELWAIMSDMQLWMADREEETEKQKIAEMLKVPVEQIHKFSVTPEQAQEILEERKKNIPPVDRGNQVLVSGKQVPEDWSHTEINKETGMQKDYIVLTEEERAKGFVRPVRRTYFHKACGTTTTMGNALAETYARDPKFYSGTFCCFCHKHFPLDQFVWEGTDEQVGS